MLPSAVPATPLTTQTKWPETELVTLLNSKMASNLDPTPLTNWNPRSVTLFPSLYQITCGIGLPLKKHFNSTSEPTAATTAGLGTSTL